MPSTPTPDSIPLDTNTRHYYRFVFLFQLAMALSITAMPLYFKAQNAISAYGMAYSAMAITGGFSFIYGQWVDKLGYAKALIIGTLLYAIALMLRLITHPVIAVMVAILAGIGACMALLSIQNWTAQLSSTTNTDSNSQSNTTKLAATRRLISQGASLIGTGSVSLLIIVLANSYPTIILLAGLLAMGSVLLLPSPWLVIKCALTGIFAPSKTKNRTTPRHCLTKTLHPNLSKQDLPQSTSQAPTPTATPTLKQRWFSLNTPIAYLLLGYTLLIGIYTGLLKPYMMLLLIDYGIAESQSVLVYFAMTVSSMLTYMLMIRYHKKLQAIFIQGFLTSEIIATLICAILGYALWQMLSVWLIIALMLFRNISFSISSTFSEISEYQLIDKDKLAILLGFSQTLFLIGDALGSLITSLLLIPNNPTDYAIICFCCAMVALINSFIIIQLKNYTKKRYAKKYN